MPGHKPSFVSTSLWQTPQACTLIRTCPTPGSGISRSTIRKSAPGLDTCATFIVPIAIAVVAINPPLNFGIVESTYCHFEMTTPLSAPLRRHLEDDFQLDRGAKRKACDAVHQTARVPVFSEDVLQQLRSGVSDSRLIANIARSGYRDAEPDDPRHFVERSQMLPRDSENIERREVSCLAARFYIKLRADATSELCLMAFRGKHSGQKKQIACLHSSGCSHAAK